MKTLIIYKSYHKMNTEKIAKVMAQEMNANLAKVEDVKPADLEKYDLIGFGSGIYAKEFHKKIYKLIEKMPCITKNVFIFSTSADPKMKHQIKEKLSKIDCKVIGDFNCSGEFSPLRFNIAHKGHPDEKDLESARVFANGLLNLKNS